jgi:hypothetical protein
VPESAVLSFGRVAQDCAIINASDAHHRAGHHDRGWPRLPPQDAPKPAAQPACDGAEVHIKERGTVRPMESFAAHKTVSARKLPTLAPPCGIVLRNGDPFDDSPK